MGALRNRAELLSVEWQEEKARKTAILLWAGVWFFSAMMGALLLTGIIVFMTPESWRIYVAAAFVLLYLGGVMVASIALRKLLRQEPFPETINQLKKDGLWLETLKD